MAGKSVEVLEQQLDDHLKECTTANIAVERRLGRIENILIGVSGAAILQLFGLVIGLVIFVFAQGQQTRPAAAPAAAVGAPVQAP